MLMQNLLHAQITEFSPQFFFLKSQSFQKTGMIVLGIWAGLNLMSGISGYFIFKRDLKFFFQMNAGWNVINLGIAVFGFSSALTMTPGIELTEMFNVLQRLDTILLINGGLDFVYIAAGSWLLTRGFKKNNARFIGYGRSVILQGGFLLIFDLAFYLMHFPLTKAIYQLTEQLNITPAG